MAKIELGSRLLTVTLGASLAVLIGASACGSSSSGGGPGSEAGAAGEAGAASEAGSSQAGEAGQGPAAGEGGEGGANEAGMFHRLGVDITVTPRTFLGANGKTEMLADDYNPLGVGVKTLDPIAEIYLGGRTLDAAHPNQALFDDLANGASKTALTPLALTDDEESWLDNDYRHAIAADLDGDGVDEIVNLYWIDKAKELHANVMRCDPSNKCSGNGGAFRKVSDSTLAVKDLTQPPTDSGWFRHSFAAADIDGDGKKELVVVNFGGVDVCTAKANFSFTCTNRVSNDQATHMSIATGHFDNSPGRVNDSLVVAFSAGGRGYVSVYDGTPNAFSGNAFSNPNHDPIALDILFADQSNKIWYTEAFVTAGDVDLDGRDEIVLAGRRPDGYKNQHHDLFLLDDATTAYRPFRAFRALLGDDGGHNALIENDVENDHFRPALRVFTKTTKPALAKAIYAGAFIFDNLQNLPTSAIQTLPSGKDIRYGVTSTDMGFFETGGGFFNHEPDDVVTGDIDGSGQDSVVAWWDQGPDSMHPVKSFTVRSIAKVTWNVGSASWARWKNIATTVNDTGFEKFPVSVALANVDRDSATVKYKGQHEVLFSDPQVLAVLAAAPFYTENESNSQTSISFGKGTGTDAQSTVGVSAGFSIGYEAPSLFGLVSASWKLSFQTSLDSISDHSVELEQTQTWTAGAEDAVVFHVIPFDVYYYQIVSSPDPADVGNTVTVNVPRSLSTYKVPVALYNSTVLNGPKIGPDVLTHTVGDPTSYPTKNVCADATNVGRFGNTAILVDADNWCYASDGTLHVGVGTGSVGIQLARSATFAAGAAQDIAVSFDTEVGAGGFSFGSSVGFHYGYSYTVNTEQSYNFSGQVGDLPSSKHGYDFGLMVHKGVLAGTSSSYPTFVVDYWVENAK